MSLNKNWAYKRNGRRNLLWGLILFFTLFSISCEALLRYRRGLPPLEPNLTLFDYRYVDIYKRLFKRVRLPNGEVIYRSNRRQATPKMFLAKKGKGLKQIFVLGGSVAQMFNDDIYLKDLLERSDSKYKYEIISCGMGQYDSYRESLIQREILNYKPDLIILMSGNNEFFTPVRVNLLAYRCDRLFRRFWVYLILQEKLLRSHLKFFVRNHPLKEGRNINFEKNLKIMIKMAKKKNIPMAICTLPTNIRDAPPLGDPLWQDNNYFLAWHAFENQHFEDAIKKFKSFVSIHPNDAFGHYFLGRSYEAMKNYPQAQIHYFRAANLDINLAIRCSPERNEIIRRLCREGDLVLVDLEKAFIKIAPNGLVGRELLWDNCHWWEEYNPLICEEMLHALIGYNETHSSRPVFALLKNLDTDSSRQALSKTDDALSEGRGFKLVLSSIGHPLMANSLDERVISLLQNAYVMSPDLFDDIPSLKERIFNWVSQCFWIQHIVSEYDKHWAVFLVHAGEAFRRMNLYSKAVKFFNEAVSLKPDIWFSFLGRGASYYKMGRIEEAKRDFDEAGKRSNEYPLVSFYREALNI